MTYNEIQDIFQTPFLKPWEHDYYGAYYATPKTRQEFLDYAYQTITNLNGLWFEEVGNMVYFIVLKGTVIPDDFADDLHIATEVPEQPTEEGTE